jgi:replicative DNA helicase
VKEEDVPWDPDAERAVLGAIQVAEGAMIQARRILDVPDFFPDHHQKIFAAAIALQSGAGRIDPVLLKGALEDRGELQAVGGPAYVGALADRAVSANVDHYAARVREKAVRRRLQDRAFLLTKECGNGNDTAQLVEVAGALYREALAADPAARGRVCSTADALDEYAADVAKGPGRKVATGIKPLDEATDRIAAGEVCTFIKRPQVGGSAMASQVLVNAAIEGVPGVFFSLEMPRPQAIERMLMQRLGLSRHEIERHAAAGWRTFTETQRAAKDALARAVVVVDRGKSGIADLDTSMIEGAAVLGRQPRLAAIDYLGLMGSGAKNLTLYQRISEAAVDVKSFAKRHGLAVMLVCQAGRDIDRKRSEGAADLGLDAARDSGQVEEACDFLVSLSRPELESDLTPAARAEVKGDLWVSVVKNRRGPLSRFRLHLDSNTLRIREWGADA